MTVQFNATCPFCGEQALFGVVTITTSDVPLEDWGIQAENGQPETCSIKDIVCDACHKAVCDAHFENHDTMGGTPCNCREEVKSMTPTPYTPPWPYDRLADRVRRTFLELMATLMVECDSVQWSGEQIEQWLKEWVGEMEDKEVARRHAVKTTHDVEDAL